MGFSKMFSLPWLAGDGPGDTCLADLDNKNQQQPPKFILNRERQQSGAADTAKNEKDGGVGDDGWEVLLLSAAQIETLTSLHINATTSEQQRLILGENLYPLVEKLEPNQAPKVTGMLLEMDQTEILHLLVSTEALKSKVAEAMDVLRKAYPSASKIICNKEMNTKDGGVGGDAQEVLSPAAQIGTMIFALANATTPEQQRLILGENLYPLVEQLEPNQAAKVTGMLLEMDQIEVLYLLASPEALKSKVAEAMDVLWKACHSAPEIIHNNEKQQSGDTSPTKNTKYGASNDAREALSPASQIGTLTFALSNGTTPEQQRLILGESLYPLVEQLEPNHAPKVTGMLLEMDQTEVLYLLESPEALKSKVAEAMDVLYKAYYFAPKIIHNRNESPVLRLHDMVEFPPLN